MQTSGYDDRAGAARQHPHVLGYPLWREDLRPGGRACPSRAEAREPVLQCLDNQRARFSSAP